VPIRGLAHLVEVVQESVMGTLLGCSTGSAGNGQCHIECPQEKLAHLVEMVREPIMGCLEMAAQAAQAALAEQGALAAQAWA